MGWNSLRFAAEAEKLSHTLVELPGRKRPQTRDRLVDSQRRRKGFYFKDQGGEVS